MSRHHLPGPETVDHALIGSTRRLNPSTNVLEWAKMPVHGANQNVFITEQIQYRLDPVREAGRHIFQIGTNDPDRAVAAARMIAADVDGIDLNAGCPKSFSTHGGMGAALLKTPDRLVAILEALVRNITPEFGIGISVKIRLLEHPADTEALVRRLVATGITGLTIHCRTTPMRPRERAIRDQLRMIADLCRDAGVACLMNGDVESRDQAAALVAEYGVDGAMMATAAEKNPSCFRAAADGGPATWREVATEYLRLCLETDNFISNTKFLLSRMVPGKDPMYRDVAGAKTFAALCRAVGLDALPDKVRVLDERNEALRLEEEAFKRKRKDEAERNKKLEAERREEAARKTKEAGSPRSRGRSRSWSPEDGNDKKRRKRAGGETGETGEKPAAALQCSF